MYPAHTEWENRTAREALQKNTICKILALSESFVDRNAERYRPLRETAQRSTEAE